MVVGIFRTGNSASTKFATFWKNEELLPGEKPEVGLRTLQNVLMVFRC